MNTKQYIAEWAKIEIPTDRHTYGAFEAVEGHNGNNQGTCEGDKDVTWFVFGPRLAETILLDDARHAANYGATWRGLLDEMIGPIITRYTFLDGQRLILVQSEHNPPLLFAGKHASFDDKEWMNQFPQEVWEE